MADENKGGALAAFLGGGGVPEKREDVAKALLDSANQGSSGESGDVVFLSYSGKLSKYSMGRDRSEPDPDALYIVEPYAAVAGWTCWKGGGVAEKHEWSVFETDKAIPASQLADHGPYKDDGDGWQFMLGVSMFDVDDPQTKIKFTTTSKSGRNVVADLTSEIAKRIIAGEPELPVMRLDDEQFTAHGKKNGKPKFAVEAWVTREEVNAFIEMGDDGDVEDLIAGNYAAGSDEAVEEAEEVEEEQPAPRKRRARRSAA